jgi:hypothetical protein
VLLRIGARMHEVLFEAIAQAQLTVTTADARGWFTHCLATLQHLQPSRRSAQKRAAYSSTLLSTALAVHCGLGKSHLISGISPEQFELRSSLFDGL